MEIVLRHRQAAVPALKSGLSESVPGIRFCAAAVLADLSPDDGRLAAILIEGLNSADLRRRAARGLGKLGQNAIAAVEPLVRGMQDEEFRMEAAAALARIAPLHPELQMFLEKWRRDVAFDVWPPKDLIVGEVARLGPVGVGELIKLLDHQDGEIREAAIETLGVIGPDARPVLPLLFDILRDPQQSDLRECVCNAIHKIGLDRQNVDAAPIFLEILISDSGYLSADELLGQLGPDVMPELVSLVDDRKAKLWPRVCAARALGIIGDDAAAAAPALASFLEKNTEALRGYETRRVIEALGNCGKNSPEAASAVAAEFPRFPESAGPALLMIGTPAIDPLLAWLDHDHADVRLAAVKFLSQFKNDSEKVRVSIIHATRDSDFTVREAAAAALGEKKHASPEVIEALLAALRDARMPVRTAAATSLGTLEADSRRVVPELVAALSDDFLSVRIRTCRALGSFGRSASNSVAAIERVATTDEFVSARVAAREALRNIVNAGR
jgi:HEAT repeat protein